MDHKEALKRIVKTMNDRHQALTLAQISDIRKVLVALQRDSYQRGYDMCERDQ
jgi:hypothetical protein